MESIKENALPNRSQPNPFSSHQYLNVYFLCFLIHFDSIIKNTNQINVTICKNP